MYLDCLKDFSARLVCFYQAIAIAIAQSSCTATFMVKSVSEIAQRYAGVLGMTPEELEDLRMNASARSKAAELVRYWKSQGLIDSSEDARDLYCCFVLQFSLPCGLGPSKEAKPLAQ